MVDDDGEYVHTSWVAHIGVLHESTSTGACQHIYKQDKNVPIKVSVCVWGGKEKIHVT